MKLVKDKQFYIQVNDLQFLKKNNFMVPDYLLLSIIDLLEKNNNIYNFVLIEDKMEINTLNKFDFIINYFNYINLSNDELETIIESLYERIDELLIKKNNEYVYLLHIIKDLELIIDLKNNYKKILIPNLVYKKNI